MAWSREGIIFSINLMRTMAKVKHYGRRIPQCGIREKTAAFTQSQALARAKLVCGIRCGNKLFLRRKQIRHVI